MDHGRDNQINQIQTRSASKGLRLPFVGVTDASFAKNEPLVEDRRLVNWKRWLKRRQKQYQALEKSGSKSKAELIMNSCEFIRPKMEMRNLMECAISFASSVPGKYGGDPGFWKMPPFLSNHANLLSSEVGPVLTKLELNSLPTLEHVAVPTSIRQEKNLLNPSQKVPSWKCSPYLKQKEQELTSYIAILQPSTPESAGLIARGRRLGHGEKYVAHVPVISTLDTSLGNMDFEDKIRASPVGADIHVALKIQNIEIMREEQSVYELSKNTSKEITWALNFVSKVNEKSGKYLYFENTGNVVITYQWRNAMSTPNILPLSSKNHASFFFNKNKALLLPGQKVEFPVWFQQRQVGIFSESWLMETTPIVSRAAFIIHMYGHATIEDFHTSQLEIDVYLNHCIRNAAVREIIDEIICNGRPWEPLEYKSLYLEGRLFRSKNPSYFYHASLIARLYRLYATTPLTDVSPWTLSLIDFRHVLLQDKNLDLRHAKLKEFSDLCQQCLGLSLFNPTRNTKYAMVYNVLCAFANRMDEESNFVKRNCILRDEENKTPNETRIRSSRDSSLAMAKAQPLASTSDRSAISLYREVFQLRTYELLLEAVEQACAVIDSLNNLNELES